MSRARIVILSGPNKGKSFPIENTLSIGRNPENDIQLDDLKVSRKHCIITRDARGILLRDLGSGNGTFVGDQRIVEYKLNHGDIIRVGTQELRFECEPSDAEGTPRVGRTHDTSVRFDHTAAEQVESADAASVYATFFQAPKETLGADKLSETHRRLRAVYAANHIIASERDLNRLFHRIMEQIFDLVPAHNGVIMLRDNESGDLVTEFVRSGSPEGVVISSSIVKRAFDNGEAVITVNAAADSRFDARASIITQNITSAMCVPLIHQNERLGIIYVDTRGTQNAFVAGDLELLVALAGAAAVAIRNAQYVRQLERAYQDTLIVLANAIELRDHYTVGHTWRVTNFSVEIARELGWSEEKLKEVQMGGVLHDVGKIAVDDAVLRKPGKLTDEEYEKIKIHPERGARLLMDVAFLRPLIPYCLYHHERWDGKGYPYGLKGEQIPIEGRLVAVADTFDALTSNRPYRKGLSPDVAVAEIEKGKGTQFDPVCADALIRCYRAGKIQRILQDYYSKDEKSVACPFCSTFIRMPEGAQPGNAFKCSVCHRQLVLRFANNAYFAELVTENVLQGVMSRQTPLPQP